MSSDFFFDLFWMSPRMYNCLITFTNKPSPAFWRCGVVGIRIKPYHLRRMPDDNVSLQDPVLDSFVWVIRHCDSPCPAKGVHSTLSVGVSGKYLCVPICHTEPDPYPLCSAWRLGDESLVGQRVWWLAPWCVCVWGVLLQSLFRHFSNGTERDKGINHMPACYFSLCESNASTGLHLCFCDK